MYVLCYLVHARRCAALAESPGDCSGQLIGVHCVAIGGLGGDGRGALLVLNDSSTLLSAEECLEEFGANVVNHGGNRNWRRREKELDGVGSRRRN